MNWVELLLLAVFFILPLLQGLLGRGKGKEGDELPPGEIDVPDEQRRPTATSVERAGTAESGGGWSADWGGWPDEDDDVLEAETSDEDVVEEIKPFIWGRASRPDTEATVTRESVREEPRVVSMEPLVINRAAEHRRFHGSIDAVPKLRARPPSPLVRMLSTPDDIRRAFVLADVIGRPRSLD
jgi:hypothetical protein